MSDAIPVNRIKGVGEKTAALFGRINVFTVEDLIGHYPRDYETYDAPVSIREVSAGSVQAIYGQITAIPNVKKVRNLSILNAVLTDDNGDSIQRQIFFFRGIIFQCLGYGLLHRLVGQSFGQGISGQKPT